MVVIVPNIPTNKVQMVAKIIRLLETNTTLTKVARCTFLLVKDIQNIC